MKTIQVFLANILSIYYYSMVFFETQFSEYPREVNTKKKVSIVKP